MSGCRIKSVRSKISDKKIEVIPRAAHSQVLNELHEALSVARGINATEFAIIMRGDGDIIFNLSPKIKNRQQYIGLLEDLKYELLRAGDVDE